MDAGRSPRDHRGRVSPRQETCCTSHPITRHGAVNGRCHDISISSSGGVLAVNHRARSSMRSRAIEPRATRLEILPLTLRQASSRYASQRPSPDLHRPHDCRKPPTSRRISHDDARDAVARFGHHGRVGGNRRIRTDSRSRSAAPRSFLTMARLVSNVVRCPIVDGVPIRTLRWQDGAASPSMIGSRSRLHETSPEVIQ